jgi:hypothetical protein
MSRTANGVGMLRAAGFLILAAAPSSALAYSNVPMHGLAVTSIELHGPLAEYGKGKWPPQIANWKANLTIDCPGYCYARAYENFFDDMVNCNLTGCANSTSRRFKDWDVPTSQLVSVLRSGYDMVFHYGHAITVQEWDYDIVNSGGVTTPYMTWSPYNYATGQGSQQIRPGWSWTSIYLCSDDTNPQCASTRDGDHYQDHIYDFGTGMVPFFGHYTGTAAVGGRGLTSADYSRADGVNVILPTYNPLTSVVIGKDFNKGSSWNYEDSVFQDPPYTLPAGGLGSYLQQLKFLILNGCQGVPVARYVNHRMGPPSNVEWTYLAQNAWKPSWRGLHLVAGHTLTTREQCFPNLDTFAHNLQTGAGVIRGYFESHTLPSQPGYCVNVNDPLFAQPGALAPRFNYNGISIYSADRWDVQIPAPSEADEAQSMWAVWYWAALG